MQYHIYSRSTLSHAHKLSLVYTLVSLQIIYGILFSLSLARSHFLLLRPIFRSRLKWVFIPIFIECECVYNRSKMLQKRVGKIVYNIGIQFFVVVVFPSDLSSRFVLFYSLLFLSGGHSVYIIFLGGFYACSPLIFLVFARIYWIISCMVRAVSRLFFILFCSFISVNGFYPMGYRCFLRFTGNGFHGSIHLLENDKDVKENEKDLIKFTY